MTHGLERSFINAIDGWLQQVLAGSRELLGEVWLECYLTCPFWRFIFEAGTCGEMPHFGVIMPSVDKVGRYFPLVVAAPLQDAIPSVKILQQYDAWCERIEEAALAALYGQMTFEAFVSLVQSMSLYDSDQDGFARLVPDSDHDRTDDCSDSNSPSMQQHLIAMVTAGTTPPRAFWSTTGGEDTAPCAFVTTGLPTPDVYAKMLRGRAV